MVLRGIRSKIHKTLRLVKKKTTKHLKIFSKSFLTVKLLRKLTFLAYSMMHWVMELSLMPLLILILALWSLLC